MPASNADIDPRSLYALIGGETGVRRLVDRFYSLMDTLPEAKACRDVHPANLDGSAAKLFDYLSGWLGGPQLYVAKHGHPMLRRRHFAAPIGDAERDGWLLCFEQALLDTVANELVRDAIREPVRRLAFHMQNK